MPALTMTNYSPHGRPESNQMYYGDAFTVSQYQSAGGMAYLGGAGNGPSLYHPPTGAANTTYSAYSSSIPAATLHNSAASSMYLSPSSPLQASYHVPKARVDVTTSQPRHFSGGSHYGKMAAPAPRLAQHPTFCGISAAALVDNTESQQSPNALTLRSEHCDPAPEGYPDVNAFDKLIGAYVEALSPKKQDKALIHAHRAANIKAVLVDKKTTTVESAQFRFWVKKMFTLRPEDPSVPIHVKKICHDGKPVAIREKLYKILIQAHKDCSHGGRDKTSAQVRQTYSWVPKELISRFVKLCPTCQLRRGTGKSSEDSPPSIGESADEHPSDFGSPSMSRRESVIGPNSSHAHFPLSMAGFSTTFQQQNRWMTSTPVSHRDRPPGSELDPTSTSTATTPMELSFPFGDHTSTHAKAFEANMLTSLGDHSEAQHTHYNMSVPYYSRSSGHSSNHTNH